MNTQKPHRVGTSLRVAGTSLAALFGTAALAVPAHSLASVEAPPGPVVRAATTDFHFDDIPVRSALQLLAEEGGFNLVVSDAVTGNVTLHLEDVTWEQVLDVVLRLKGLEQTVIGDSRTVDVRR
jgi:type II secretory pathway component HofQ